MSLKLYNFFRNSAGYRVRIALALKGLDYEYKSVSILPGNMQQLSEAYKAVNPQALIPTLEHDGARITQSIAICEYLEEMFPAPTILPKDPVTRAQARAFAAAIACEVHPINMVRTHRYMEQDMKLSAEQRDQWYKHWAMTGLAALEQILAAREKTMFAFGGYPTVADIFLIPQCYNFRKANIDFLPYPRISEITARCEQLAAFAKAAPEVQPDAVPL